jgi:threonylcarbamoyladenosine tRNA methylthiotransferase CDKAL1
MDIDIEDTGDLLKNLIPSKDQKSNSKNKTKIKIKPHSKKKSFEEEEEKNKNKKINIYIKTFGCSHNASDSEYMAGILASEGYSIVNSLEQSDLTIINSCTVKSPSQASFLNTVIKSQNFNKKLIVGGCVPQAERNLKGLENISIVGVSQIDKINLIVKETLKGNVIRFLENKKLPSLLLPKIRRNKFIEIIPISQGCLGSCTYCKTKQARGKLISYPIKEILESCKKAYLNNAKELWITSEDTGVYGRDIGTNLPNLLVEILKEIPEDVMIRIGMANPPYILENINNMIKILNHPNVYSFIHIPVQSGSNAVLDKMLREYTIEEFNFLCDKFIEGVPNITLATDIICGFPTETKENFEETLNLVEKYKFPVINISQFYPRPGTVAAKWKKIDTKEVHNRSKTLAELFQSYSHYKHLLNTEQRVWIHDINEEEKNKEENMMVGHNKSYVKILIPKDESLYGKEIIVKIKEIFKWHCVGEIVDKNPKHLKVDYNEYFKDILRQKNIMIKNYFFENNFQKIYSIHDTFNMNLKNKNNKDMDNDLRKYKDYFEKKKGNKFNKYLGVIMYIITFFYFLYCFSKTIKLK